MDIAHRFVLATNWRAPSKLSMAAMVKGDCCVSRGLSQGSTPLGCACTEASAGALTAQFCLELLQALGGVWLGCAI